MQWINYRIPTLCIVFLIMISCSSQVAFDNQHQTRSPTPYDTITFADLPEGFPRYGIIPSDSIAVRVADGSLPKSLSYHNYLQIGHYTLVNQSTELSLDWGLDSNDIDEIERLDDFKLADAEGFIVDRAAQVNLTIITEAHTKPQHRVFTRCLLDNLYAIGYRHLGLENITPGYQTKYGEPLDTNLMKRGYPIQSPLSGIYSSEPEYGNLIRHAIDLGFTIFAYERNGSSESERDLQQAEHVIAYQSQHPGEKIICHGGWYHATEERVEKSPGSGSYWLAYHYKTLTGDDPLTVYQDAMNEKIAVEQSSSPYYTALLNRMSVGEKPKVLVNDSGHTWRGPNDDMPFDIVTVEPPLGSEDGAGGWLGWECDGKNYATLDLASVLKPLNSKLKKPVIIEVRQPYDSPIATPIYAVEVDPATVLPTINLWKGWYRMTVKTAGEILSEEFVKPTSSGGFSRQALNNTKRGG